jgi:hypothetical protein
MRGITDTRVVWCVSGLLTARREVLTALEAPQTQKTVSDHAQEDTALSTLHAPCIAINVYLNGMQYLAPATHHVVCRVRYPAGMATN